MSLPHLPVIRLGKSYASLKKNPVVDYRSGETLAEISLINAGAIRRDLLKRIDDSKSALRKFTCEQLVDISVRAGEQFLNATLPLGDGGHTQSPGDYIATLSATSGLPHVMVRRNMEKIHNALVNMRTVLNGLTRGLDLSVLDRGFGEQAGCPVSFYPTASSLGLVMPSNSPAVNSLWLPAIPLKTPVIIKPGSAEPWTPYRLVQAFIAAGCPSEAFGFYPADHEGSGEIIRTCGRVLVFGDKNTVAQYASDAKVQVHGPGFSKIVIGEDEIENWERYLDLMAASISENGGRSCINASAVFVPKYGKEIAEALAKRLAAFEPLPPEDENAKLSGFANARMAEFIDAAIEQDLAEPGAEDVTARFRQGPRLVRVEGGTYLKPCIVHCANPRHPLANREFLFPYASVVELPRSEILKSIGPTLVVAAYTRDESFINELLESPDIERLNLGPVPTMKVSWDQPHEGNMFEFLYRRRSIEKAA